jgi:anti-sigma factor RsiW
MIAELAADQPVCDYVDVFCTGRRLTAVLRQTVRDADVLVLPTTSCAPLRSSETTTTRWRRSTRCRRSRFRSTWSQRRRFRCRPWSGLPVGISRSVDEHGVLRVARTSPCVHDRSDPACCRPSARLMGPTCPVAVPASDNRLRKDGHTGRRQCPSNARRLARRRLQVPSGTDRLVRRSAGATTQRRPARSRCLRSCGRTTVFAPRFPGHRFDYSGQRCGLRPR